MRVNYFLIAFFWAWVVLTLPFYSHPAYADATITIVNNDANDEGFNDPGPPDHASTVGGNPGATLGAQRLIAFQFAAGILTDKISSAVPILVDAEMNPLFCASGSAILGQAGPNFVFANTPNTVPDTWYGDALADALAGVDQNPGFSDIGAEFNSRLNGAAGCLGGTDWYYGLDASPPSGAIDFVTTVLHELLHGLNFLTLVSETSGTEFLGTKDIFELFVEDHTSGRLFADMTDAQRLAAGQSGDDLHWVGANVITAAGCRIAGRDRDSSHTELYAPDPSSTGASLSHWNRACYPNQLMEPFATGANHDPGLALSVLLDMGWTMLPDTCGDGVVDGAEECDAAGETAACDTDCSFAFCGDGALNTTAGEACDAAGESDVCDSDCTPASCGDGLLNTTAGEVCDTGGESAACNADCTAAACGDGTLNVGAGEQCDDGGSVDGDGCSAACLFELCGDGIVNPGEACDDGGESDACNADCTIPSCGDGALNATAGEVCDDGGESAICNNDCTPAACGDGRLNMSTAEQCDDGNTAVGDGCDADCLIEVGPLDYFVMYRSTPFKSEPRFVPFGPVTLTDRFRTSDYVVTRSSALGVPADKNGDGISNDVIHLQEFPVKPANRSASQFQGLNDVRIINQCNDLNVSVARPVSILVPSHTRFAAQPDAPTEPSVDHFLCYLARLERKANGIAQRFPKGIQVTVADALQTRRYGLLSVSKLCTPVDKSGNPVFSKKPKLGQPVPTFTPALRNNPNDHLVCYKAVRAGRTIPQAGCGPADPDDRGQPIVPKQTRHVPRTLFVNNQFGPMKLTTRREAELCVPSSVVLPR